MAEKSREEIIDSWFFPGLVGEGRNIVAPKEAIEKRDELREIWLPTAEMGRNETPVVKLTPVTKGEQTGWKVETAVRTKPDTVSNKSPVKNN